MQWRHVFQASLDVQIHTFRMCADVSLKTVYIMVVNEQDVWLRQHFTGLRACNAASQRISCVWHKLVAF